MKPRTAFTVGVSLLLIAGLATAGEEKESEQLVVLQEFAVYPDGIADFEASLKALAEAAAEHDLDYGWDVFAVDDMRFTVTIWVEGLAGLEATAAKWEAFAKAWDKDEFAAWDKGFAATYEYAKSTLWHPRKDLSYLPENAPKENDFFFWGSMTVKPGHMEAVEDCFKRWVDLYSEHEVAHGWRAAIGGMGTEVPVLGFFEWAESAAAFFTRVDEIHTNEELTKASEPIWQDLLPHLRGFENFTGMYRKDLSYYPEEKAE
jgi:hypothetical protein